MRGMRCLSDNKKSILKRMSKIRISRFRKFEKNDLDSLTMR
jgi:hypothetical protein